MNISIVIVTSPAISNPDTFLIDSVIDSLELIHGLETAQIIIILDGYIINDKAQTKKGRITVDMESNYKEYLRHLQDKYKDDRFLIRMNHRQMGFALSVKNGLELCQTKFALILQHDRKFIYPFSGLSTLASCMEENPHIRYIHFPTIMSMKHTSSLRRYGLHYLTDPETMYFPLQKEYELRPVIFWYDSNHLCHVQRYLEIYTPYQSMPDPVKEIMLAIDRKALTRMVLKRGDFIEDKFGQVQRNSLVALRGDPSAGKKVFRWFGSYVLWHDDKRAGASGASDGDEKDEEEDVKGGMCEYGDGDVDDRRARYPEEEEAGGTAAAATSSSQRAPLSMRSCIMVTHLRGRHYAPLHAATFQQQHDTSREEDGCILHKVA
jgi:hypothetical protein